MELTVPVVEEEPDYTVLWIVIISLCAVVLLLSVLYERKKEPYLKIYRAGNLGAPSVSDDYIQKKEIEANEGAVHLDMIGCCGFQKGIMELEILSVADSTVTISANGKQYKLTPEERIEIIDSDLSDGIGQYDTLIIQCIMK